MPETKIISNQASEFNSEIEDALADGWIPDEFYGPNGVKEVNKQIRHYFIKYSDQKNKSVRRKTLKFCWSQTPTQQRKATRLQLFSRVKHSYLKTANPKTQLKQNLKLKTRIFFGIVGWHLLFYGRAGLALFIHKT